MANELVGQQCSGKVMWFDAAKGFGFISYTEGQGKDIFVHYSGILVSGFKTLEDGDEVEFIVTEGGSGKLQATQVKVVARSQNGSSNDRQRQKKQRQ